MTPAAYRLRQLRGRRLTASEAQSQRKWWLRGILERRKEQQQSAIAIAKSRAHLAAQLEQARLAFAEIHGMAPARH